MPKSMVLALVVDLRPPPVETDDAVDHYNKTKEDDKCPDDTSTLDIRKMPEELFSSL